MLKNGIGASIFLFLLAGMCLLGVLIGEKIDNYNFAYNCNFGMIACFVLAIVVLILSIALHFSIAHTQATNSQDKKASNIILIRNGEPIQIDPKDISYLANGYLPRELPRGNNQIELDPKSIQALAELLNQATRYLPKHEREEGIRRY